LDKTLPKAQVETFGEEANAASAMNIATEDANKSLSGTLQEANDLLKGAQGNLGLANGIAVNGLDTTKEVRSATPVEVLASAVASAVNLPSKVAVENATNIDLGDSLDTGIPTIAKINPPASLVATKDIVVVAATDNKLPTTLTLPDNSSEKDEKLAIKKTIEGVTVDGTKTEKSAKWVEKVGGKSEERNAAKVSDGKSSESEI